MKVILILIFILFININFTHSQSTDLKAQLQISQMLYNEEHYFDAITEFKRLLYFDNENDYSFIANYMIGKSYKMGAKLSDAIIYFTKAEIAAENYEDIYKAKIEKIRCNILRRTTENANHLLNEIEADVRYKNKIDEIYFWHGWIDIFSDDWEKAAEDFNKSKIDTTLSAYCDSVYEERYSIVFATISSAIIPGLGQFYTGNYLSGLLSLGWNVLWGYVTVNAFIDNRIFDGFAVANLLWLRFYNGNLQNAKKFAEENNLKISNYALYYLQYQYKGLKP